MSTTVAPSASDKTDELAHTWARKRGIVGFFTEVDHKVIGRRFILLAMTMFTFGGIEALLMRTQLAQAENGFLGPDLYNQIFTVHGTTMMFLFAVPVMEGLGIYFVPLMVGTRNIAMPRLVAFAWWMYLGACLLLNVAFVLNIGPDAGWFNYTPLSGPEFSPGKRVDVWAQVITFSELSAISSSICLIATILKQRAPGMSINRMPIFVWAQLVKSVMVIFAMPAVVTASTCLALDRLVGTHFFNPAEGGDPLLWQHLFWFFAHPEVYIIFLPATGFVSTFLPAFTRRQVFGYPAIVLSLVTTAFVGFGVWVHHMFATGLPQVGESYFTASSLLISIPTGVQIFCWIATIWTGELRYRVPLLFVFAFIVTFVIGGLTGVMLASVPIDLQVHDTFFVVAHLHYVLIGGAVFPLLGALYYWFPKITGKRMHEGLGVLNVALLFVGFHLTFFPMHQLGLQGMPRRMYTYLEGTGWERLNLIATIGAFTIALAVLVFVANVVRSLLAGQRAGPDPWESETLEWATSSPPPTYNFAELPTVTGTAPLWDHPEEHPVVVGLRSDERQVLVTDTLDAEPDHRGIQPGPAVAPFVVALGLAIFLVGVIFTPWAPFWGLPVTGIGGLLWFWPRKPHHELLEEQP